MNVLVLITVEIGFLFLLGAVLTVGEALLDDLFEWWPEWRAKRRLR